MGNIQPVEKDYMLWLLMLRTKEVIHRVREKELNKVGVSPIEAGVMYTVESMDKPATPAEISRWLFREPHSVSGLLNRMQQEGLITKTKNLKRKNQVRITLTEKGQQAFQMSLKRVVVNRIFSALSEEQKGQLKAILQTLLDAAVSELGVEREFPYLRWPSE
ncbi:MAG: MarR family winged helix-turn-helix transcriptional regulator [Chloroflexota bacterium]